MEAVGKETADGLAHLDALTAAAEGGGVDVEDLVARTAAVLTRQATPESAIELIDGLTSSGLSVAAAKELYAATCSVLLEAAKADCNADSFIPVLEEAGLASALARRLAAAFEPTKPALRWMLKGTGVASRRVVDLQWRLDHQVRSSRAGAALQAPVYLVSLKTLEADGVTLGSEDFTCTQAQMQDLLASVRNATKEVERLLDAPAAATAASLR